MDFSVESAKRYEPLRWMESVRLMLNRLQSLDWQTVTRDVRPFLEEPSELSAFTSDMVRAMIEKGH